MIRTSYNYICLVVLLLLSLAAQAQPRFVPELYNARVGEVMWQSPKHIAFAFQNKGNEPLLINEVQSGCGCVDVKWPASFVDPGERGVITATFDAALLGTFVKELAVYTNASAEPIYLSFQGRVVTDKLDFSGDFPIDLGSVRMSTNYIEFDNVNRGDYPVAELQVVNLERTPYHPELMHLPPYLKAEAVPSVIAGGRPGRLLLTLDSEKLHKMGLTQTSIYLSRFPGDKVSESNEILISAVLLPDLSKISSHNAPRLTLSQESVDFGSLGKKKKMTQVVTVTNNGQGQLNFSTVQVFNPAVEVSLGDRILQPGESTKLKITVKSQNLMKSKSRPRVLLICNDPEHAKTVIPISVTL